MTKNPTVSLPLRSLFAFLVLLCLSAPAFAQADGAMVPNEDGDYLPDTRQQEPLSEAELIEAFTDKTHLGTYNFQRRDIGTIAFEETTTADGRTIHRQGTKVDSGTWRVRANVICFEYEDFSQNGRRDLFCFNIYKVGNCYYHYGLGIGRGGFGLRGGNFTARSVHAGETANCQPAFV